MPQRTRVSIAKLYSEMFRSPKGQIRPSSAMTRLFCKTLISQRQKKIIIFTQSVKMGSQHCYKNKFIFVYANFILFLWPDNFKFIKHRTHLKLLSFTNTTWYTDKYTLILSSQYGTISSSFCYTFHCKQ